MLHGRTLLLRIWMGPFCSCFDRVVYSSVGSVGHTYRNTLTAEQASMMIPLTMDDLFGGADTVIYCTVSVLYSIHLYHGS